VVRITNRLHKTFWLQIYDLCPMVNVAISLLWWTKEKDFKRLYKRGTDKWIKTSAWVLMTQCSAAQMEFWLVEFGLNNLTTECLQEEKRKNRHQSKGSVNAISQPLGIHALTFSLSCVQCSFHSLWLTNRYLMYDIWQTRAVLVSCI